MYRLFLILLLSVATLLTACTRGPGTPAGDTTAAPDPATSAYPVVAVYKSPDCSCCARWVSHLRLAGFKVDVRNRADLNPVKTRLGVPLDKYACHTAEVGGYFVEGHVPAQDIKRLLAEKPDAKGLAVPGMPVGSPGMEAPHGTTQPYDVLLVAHDNSGSTFARHGDDPAKAARP